MAGALGHWIVRVVALLVAVSAGLFWYFSPTQNAPKSLSGRSWSYDCDSAPHFQWGDGYELVAVKGTEIGSTQATFSRSLTGYWINEGLQSFHFAIDGDRIRQDDLRVAGVKVHVSGKIMKPCDASVLQPGSLPAPESDDASIGKGLLAAIVVKDAAAVKQILSRISSIGALPNIKDINAFSSNSSPEIYGAIQQAQGRPAPNSAAKIFAMAGKPWTPVAEIPAWLRGRFSLNDCALAYAQYDASSRSGMALGERRTPVSMRAVALSGDRALITWADGMRSVYERLSADEHAMLGTIMESGALAPGSKRVVFRRCGVSSDGQSSTAIPSLSSASALPDVLSEDELAETRGPAHLIAGPWVPEGEYCASGAGMTLKPGGEWENEDQRGRWHFENDVLYLQKEGRTVHEGTTIWPTADEFRVTWRDGSSARRRRCSSDGSIEPWFPNVRQTQ